MSSPPSSPRPPSPRRPPSPSPRQQSPSPRQQSPSPRQQSPPTPARQPQPPTPAKSLPILSSMKPKQLEDSSQRTKSPLPPCRSPLPPPVNASRNSGTCSPPNSPHSQLPPAALNSTTTTTPTTTPTTSPTTTTNLSPRISTDLSPRKGPNQRALKSKKPPPPMREPPPLPAEDGQFIGVQMVKYSSSFSGSSSRSPIPSSLSSPRSPIPSPSPSPSSIPPPSIPPPPLPSTIQDILKGEELQQLEKKLYSWEERLQREEEELKERKRELEREFHKKEDTMIRTARSKSEETYHFLTEIEELIPKESKEWETYQKLLLDHAPPDSGRRARSKTQMMALREYDEASVRLLQQAVRKWLMRRRWKKLSVDFKGSQASLQLRLRNEAIKEVVDSERVYVGSLEFALSYFLVPLEDRVSLRQPLLSGEQISLVFQTLDLIEALNRTLLNELEVRMKQWPAVTHIGDIFRRMVPILKLYSNYIRGFKKAQDGLAEFRNENKDFHEWLIELESDEKCKLPLLSYLIMPVQRLPRYQLLIDGVLKYLPEDHTDYSNLTTARNSVVSVIRHIEEQSRIREHREKILALQNELKLPHLFSGKKDRRIIAEAPIQLTEMDITRPSSTTFSELTSSVFRTARDMDYTTLEKSEALLSLFDTNKSVGLLQEGGMSVSILVKFSQVDEKTIVKVCRPMVLFRDAGLTTISLSITETTTVDEFLTMYKKKVKFDTKNPSLILIHRESNLPISAAVSSLQGMSVTSLNSWEGKLYVFSDHLVFFNDKKKRTQAAIPLLYLLTQCGAATSESTTAAAVMIGGIHIRITFSSPQMQEFIQKIEKSFGARNGLISTAEPLLVDDVRLQPHSPGGKMMGKIEKGDSGLLKKPMKSPGKSPHREVMDEKEKRKRKLRGGSSIGSGILKSKVEHETAKEYH